MESWKCSPWNRSRGKERERRKKQREREKDRGERGASVISRVPGSCVRARFNELGRISLVDNERRLDEPSSKLRLSRFFQLEPQVFRVNHRKLRGYLTFHPPLNPIFDYHSAEHSHRFQFFPDSFRASKGVLADTRGNLVVSPLR